MKTTLKIIVATLILSFTSCEKEEILEPVQVIKEVNESVNATSSIVPKLSLEIRRTAKDAPYHELRKNKTVWFNESFWLLAPKLTSTGFNYAIWSSPDGSNWTVRRNNPFPIAEDVDLKMVVHDGKILAIGKNRSSVRQIYSSSNGVSWNHVTSNLPFPNYNNFDAVAFKNKIFILEKFNSLDDIQKVYSSTDGINWTLDNANALPYLTNGTLIVFKDKLYYMGGLGRFVSNTNVIWKTDNGRDWSPVSGATPSYLRPTEDFPVKFMHAAVVHNNSVWVTGGAPISGDTAQGKDIWVSSDMENWAKYTGPVPFESFNNPTMLSYGNKILLLGGYFFTSSSGAYEYSKSIWSIKPRSSVRLPVDIPREDRPTIPLF